MPRNRMKQEDIINTIEKCRDKIQGEWKDLSYLQMSGKICENTGMPINRNTLAKYLKQLGLRKMNLAIQQVRLKSATKKREAVLSCKAEIENEWKNLSYADIAGKIYAKTGIAVGTMHVWKVMKDNGITKNLDNGRRGDGFRCAINPMKRKK